MEILIGILCVPVGLLALCLIIALFFAFYWLFDHGLCQMMCCACVSTCFGIVANMILGTTSYTILIVSAIVGALLGLLLYVHMELESIKEHSKDDKS